MKEQGELNITRKLKDGISFRAQARGGTERGRTRRWHQLAPTGQKQPTRWRINPWNPTYLGRWLAMFRRHWRRAGCWRSSRPSCRCGRECWLEWGSGCGCGARCTTPQQCQLLVSGLFPRETRNKHWQLRIRQMLQVAIVLKFTKEIHVEL